MLRLHVLIRLLRCSLISIGQLNCFGCQEEDMNRPKLPFCVPSLCCACCRWLHALHQTGLRQAVWPLCNGHLPCSLVRRVGRDRLVPLPKHKPLANKCNAVTYREGDKQLRLRLRLSIPHAGQLCLDIMVVVQVWYFQLFVYRTRTLAVARPNFRLFHLSYWSITLHCTEYSACDGSWCL
jgi:hypothetical protein